MICHLAITVALLADPETRKFNGQMLVPGNKPCFLEDTYAQPQEPEDAGALKARIQKMKDQGNG